MNPPTTPTNPPRTTAVPRNRYIFIDYENVCEADLSRIVGKSAKVFMILGTRHKKLPTSLFLFAQSHPAQVRIIQTPVDGRNALDMLLALELGQLLAADPDGYFHIVSKDTDFESIVRHLTNEKKLIARYASLAHVPALRTLEERLAHLKAELEDSARPRPATRKTLENKIKSVFENKADPAFIQKTIEDFVKTGILDFTETGKVQYKVA